ncbi:MAG: hypothetical protein AB1345_00590 [Chloroflexota bacterium]
MTRSRWLVLVIIVASLVILAVSALFGEQPWNTFRAFRDPFSSKLSSSYSHVQIFSFLASFSSLITLYLSGILVLFFFPLQVRQMGKVLTSSLTFLARYTLLGLVTALLMCVLIISSSLSLGTFPLTLLLGGILFITSFVGYTVLALKLGQSLLNRAHWRLSPLFSLLLGLLILYPLSKLPFIGIALTILFLGLGLGVVIATRFGSDRQWELDILQE